MLVDVVERREETREREEETWLRTQAGCLRQESIEQPLLGNGKYERNGRKLW